MYLRGKEMERDRQKIVYAFPQNKNLLRYNCVVFNMFHCGEKMIPSHGVCLNIERKKG